MYFFSKIFIKYIFLFFLKPSQKINYNMYNTDLYEKTYYKYLA